MPRSHSQHEYAPHIRPAALETRRKVCESRDRLAAYHDAGSLGVQICTQLTDLVDESITGLFRTLVSDGIFGTEVSQPAGIVLVAHGGYGRGDIAPYSDVDFMIIHDRIKSETITRFAGRIMNDLYDAGLDLAQTVRSPHQACQLAIGDSTIVTSLMESRFLAGDEELFETFRETLARRIHRRRNSMVPAIFSARGEERKKYGGTVYLLEPNVKRSPGTLRDLQLLRWIGFARYGVADFDGLQLAGHLTIHELRAVRRAREFLLRLRNELHFHAGKAHDTLDRGEQVRLADKFGYRGSAAILPVENFMRDYFRITTEVRQIVSRFINRAKTRSAWARVLFPLLSHQVERDFLVGPSAIVANKRGLQRVKQDVAEILRLMDLANLYDKRIDDRSWDAICEAVPELPADVSPEAVRRFMALLSQPARLYELLRGLYELGVLEKLIPAFRHARCLLQFNLYHQYTVDEHCLRAVLEAARFQSDQGPLGKAYRSIRNKQILHLALLIHDLGKGHAEDHSEVGRRIAGDVAARLRMSPQETETLKFLVHKHLRMSHLAFRRDTNDDRVVIDFAIEVGSPEILNWLFVLTAADIAAVGPGNLNDWKVELLHALYHQTMAHLAGDTASIDSPFRVEASRRRIRECLTDQGPSDWYNRQIEALPTSWLYGTPSEYIAAVLRELRNLPNGEVAAWAHYHEDTATVEYTVGTHEDVTPGIFHKLTGAVSSQGLQILSAEIHTLDQGLVLDRFRVIDLDYEGPPPEERLDSVRRRLVESLRSATFSEPSFRRIWHGSQGENPGGLAHMPTLIRIDNSTSDRCTILDIFAHDRLGLLYRISRTLFELGLSVHLAKIGTYLDQVVDVFYVTDFSGHKIVAEQFLEHIRERLLHEIDEFQLAS